MSYIGNAVWMAVCVNTTYRFMIELDAEASKVSNLWT